jgi:hypothetical protein
MALTLRIRNNFFRIPDPDPRCWARVEFIWREAVLTEVTIEFYGGPLEVGATVAISLFRHAISAVRWRSAVKSLIVQEKQKKTLIEFVIGSIFFIIRPGFMREWN